MELMIDTPRGVARVHLEEVTHLHGLLVLGHGAGGGVESPDLDAARAAGLAAGFAVARVEQPYRVLGRKAPPPIAHAQEAWVAVVADLRARLPDGALVVGGRSFGARVACRSAAEVAADGVLCLAYPLVAPSGNDRAAELAGVAVPTLVIQGRSDPFGRPRRARNRRVVTVEGTHRLDRERAKIERTIRTWLGQLGSDS